MNRKQWIWLIVAVLLFAGAGTVSVLVNTWSRQTVVESWDSFMLDISDSIDGFYDDTELYGFPGESFLAQMDISGTIAGSSSVSGLVASDFDLDYTLDYIDRLMNCPENEGILLYINSGGGEMAASDEVYLKLLDYKKETGRPIYAYFDGTACSGAYYIAMAADEIYANRNCICVNIGVYIQTYNLSGLFEKYGIEQIMIRSSDNKGIGAMGQPWTEEQLAIYQSIVDLYYDQFLEVVADGRDMTKDMVRELDDGREMLASQALQAGFIDGIGRFEEYRNQVIGYYDDIEFYAESPVQMDYFSMLLRDIYGAVEAMTPRTELEMLQGLMEEDDGIVVMAYAG